MRSEKLKRVGFWAAYKGIMRLPAATFDLPHPGDLVDPHWPIRERELVAAYLDAAPDVEHWMGYAYCRLGCDGGFGTTDKSDGTYLWPEGLSHYVLKHSVRLPEDFIQHIRKAVEGYLESY